MGLGRTMPKKRRREGYDQVRSEPRLVVYYCSKVNIQASLYFLFSFCAILPNSATTIAAIATDHGRHKLTSIFHHVLVVVGDAISNLNGLG